MNHPLEPPDLRLLLLLQENGALTNQQLADAAALSASQVSRRRQALEEAGVIAGYRALIDRERLGFGVTVYVNVSLHSHSPDNSRRFADLVRRTPEVQEAHALTGEADYLLKVVARDLKDLARLVNAVLLPHESVDRVRSEIVLETLKETAALPL
jgi:DNA-binding Lrp family transcriptional regulator